MEPRILDAKEAAKHNTFFRRVLFTAERSQLVLMSLLPSEEIGMEIHDGDQLLYAVNGEGVAVINGARDPFDEGAMLCVPAGAPHNVINTGERPLKLFTIYAPPQHAPGTIQVTQADANAAEARGHLPVAVS